MSAELFMELEVASLFQEVDVMLGEQTEGGEAFLHSFFPLMIGPPEDA